MSFSESNTTINAESDKSNYVNLCTLNRNEQTIVIKAKHTVTGQLVAIKTCHYPDYNLEDEFKILRKVQHKNVITLLNSEYKDCLIMEFMDMSLSSYIKQVTKMNPLLVKSYMWQLLTAIAHCHTLNVIHRDIKPHNILIDKVGNLKLCDFGWYAISGIPPHNCTHYIGTLCYRPPDVLLGNTSYSYDFDIWSTGCVFGEMLTGRILFDSNYSIDQLLGIFRKMGTPTPTSHPDICNLPGYVPNFPVWKISPLKINCDDPLAMDLLTKMLQYSPSQRISAKEALNHQYFQELKDKSIV